MRGARRTTKAVCGVVAFCVLSAGWAVWAAANGPATVEVCVNQLTGAVRRPPSGTCNLLETPLSLAPGGTVGGGAAATVDVVPFPWTAGSYPCTPGATSDFVVCGGADYPGFADAYAAAVDWGAYPAGATARWEFPAVVGVDGDACYELRDLVSGGVVPGSRFCRPGPDALDPGESFGRSTRVVSDDFPVPASGEGLLVPVAEVTGGGVVNVGGPRLVVDW